MLRRAGTEKDIFDVLTSLGILALSRGYHARAAATFEEALSLARKVEDVRGMAVCLNNLGFTTLFRGDAERATVLFEEALERNQEVGDTRGIATSLINLGLAALTKGDPGRAAGLLEGSLALFRELENEQIVAEWLEAMAGVAAVRGKAQRATHLWGAAQALREGIGVPLPSDEYAILEPHVALARAQLGEETWEATLAEGQELAPERAMEYALSREEEPAPSAPSGPERRPSVDEPSVALTRREEEVASLVAQGMTNRQIASKLFLSEHTVKRHISKILRKLALASRAEVAAWATERLPLTSPFE